MCSLFSVSKLCLTALLIVFGLGCHTGAEIGEQSQVIVNGEASPNDEQVVALVYHGNAFCTGTLVGKRTVLTAAHCLPPHIDVPARGIEVFFGTDMTNAEGVLLPVLAALANPEWNSDLVAGDVGVLALVRDAPVIPMPMAYLDVNIHAAGVTGAEVRAVGFGITEAEGEGSGLRRTGMLTLDRYNDFSLFLSAGPSATCNGDSGGALIFLQDGVEVLGGIHTRSDCGNVILAERVDAHVMDFILPFMEEHEGAASCSQDGMCASGCKSADPDCPCVEDGLCSDACAYPSADVDCQIECAADGVCDESCSYDVDCAGNGANLCPEGDAKCESTVGCSISAAGSSLWLALGVLLLLIRRSRALLFALSLLSLAACDPVAEPGENGDKADVGSCANTAECGTRNIEVIFTNPFCDECTAAEKDILLQRSQIIARVIDLIEGAQGRIDIAQFTFSRKNIEAALVAAHARGVVIRLAIDAGQDRDGSLARRLRDAGIDVRFVQGKAAGSRFGLLHTKFMMVDGETLLTGSNNWSSTGTSINNENTMIIRGEPGDELIGGFACHFESIWNSKPDEAVDCSGKHVFFTPGSAARIALRDSIRSAHTSIDVLMHHFTFKDLAKELAKAQEAGVSVRVIVNEADRSEVSGSKFQRLLDAGGEIHFKRVNEDAFQFMHNKLVLIDGEMLINGSGNWSGSAFFNNYENFVRYFEPDVVRQFEDMYDRLWTWSVSAEGLDAGLTGAQQHAVETGVYFGNLHAHFSAHAGGHKLDDGRDHQLDAEGEPLAIDVGDSVGAAALHAFEYAQRDGGLDFMALSPHVTNDNAADSPDMANMSQESFEEMTAMVEQVNDTEAGHFVALASMEWSTNSTGNHLGIFGTKQLAKVERGQFDALYDGFLPERRAVGERPLLMMNHPRTMRQNEEFLTGSWDQIYGVNLQDIPNNSQRKKKFNDYGLDDYSPLKEVLPSWIDGSAMPDRAIVAQTLDTIRFASAPYMRLMEVTIGRGTYFGDESSRNPSLFEDEDGNIERQTKVHSDFDYYLEHGFRIAPVANHDNHFANWGTGHSSRTGVVSHGLSKKKLLDALDRRRVFASEDENLSLHFYVNDRVPMGSETATTGAVVKLSALISDPDYSGAYEVKVYRGTTNGQAMEVVQTLNLAADGWTEVEVSVVRGSTNIFYLEVLEVGANRMAWTAPIWVNGL